MHVLTEMDFYFHCRLYVQHAFYTTDVNFRKLSPSCFVVWRCVSAKISSVSYLFERQYYIIVKTGSKANVGRQNSNIM